MVFMKDQKLANIATKIAIHSSSNVDKKLVGLNDHYLGNHLGFINQNLMSIPEESY